MDGIVMTLLFVIDAERSRGQLMDGTAFAEVSSAKRSYLGRGRPVGRPSTVYYVATLLVPTV